MKKWMRGMFLGLAGVFALGLGASLAMAYGPGVGEDPFPLRCADFSGQWRSDSGARYSIQQRSCAWLRFQLFHGSGSGSMTIVPDNRVRPGPGRGDSVRHRWNTCVNPSILETHRNYLLEDMRISEVTMFEMVSQDLLLETIYRSIQDLADSGKVRHDYFQTVFRRMDKFGEEQDRSKRSKY